MKCYICDRDDDLISFDREHVEFSPCVVCQAAIAECLEEFENEEEPN